MPCVYVSVTSTQITDIKLLCRSLDILGERYEVRQVGNAAVILSRNFRIEINSQGADISRADGSGKWIEKLQDRYAAEEAKRVAKRKGYFCKEETLPDGRLKLSLRK